MNRNNLKIESVSDPVLYEKISPDFIYNRIDMFASDFELLAIYDDKRTYYVEVEFNKSDAILGMWLNDVSREALDTAIKYIFDNRPKVKCIHYEYGFLKVGKYVQKNHFRIDLPDTEEELRSRLSSKGRYNIKREKRLLNDNFGHYSISEFTSEDVPEQVILEYFRMKRVTHGVDYHMTPKEYLEKYHVTHVYALYLGERLSAVLLSCEQCEVVYIENITYDIEYSKYSLGQILYDIYLARLIKKGKKEIFLAGGDLEYKKRYGSIEDITYNCVVFRYIFDEIVYSMKQKLRQEVKPKLQKINCKGKRL